MELCFISNEHMKILNKSESKPYQAVKLKKWSECRIYYVSGKS